MKNIKIFLFTSIVIILFVNSLNAQDNIRTFLKSKYGADKGIDIWALDSLDKYTVADIHSKYSTYEGCVFFVVDEINNHFEIPQKTIVGVFRDNRVVWQSDTLVSGSDWGIAGIQEINNDNNAELIATSMPSCERCNAWPYATPAYIWILSFDGSNVTFLNGIDPVTRESLLKGNDGFDMGDFDGDGYYEIVMHNSTHDYIEGETEDDELIDNSIDSTWTVSWDGSKFSYIPGSRQLTKADEFRKDKVDVNVSAYVNLAKDNLLRVNYIIENMKTSYQKIKRFLVSDIPENFIVSKPKNWGAGHYFDCCKSFQTINGDIIRGETKKGFAIRGNGLPSIRKYYIQGEDGLNAYVGLSTSYEQVRDGCFTNAVSGYTIAPVEKTTDYLGLVDSLEYFITKSTELGWIKNEATSYKYSDMITQVQNKLNAGDNFGAKAILSAMKTESVADSTDNLTSEAFALIYYNTEYLESQIPDTGGPVNLVINPDFESGDTDHWNTNNAYGGAVCTLKVNSNLPMAGNYDAIMHITVAGTSNSRPLISASLSESKQIGKKYKLSFRTKVISGNPAIRYVNYGAGLKLFNAELSGEQEWEFICESATNTTSSVPIYINGTQLGEFAIDEVVYIEIE